jgi:hypothetical protein
MKKFLVAGAALAVLSLGGHANAAVYPSVGDNTAGPSLIITIGSTGTATIAAGPSTGPYDGSEDTYIGVVNNSSTTVKFLHLSSPGTDIFGFDGDGIDGYNGNSIAPVTGNPDDTGYGGPLGYFTNINSTYDAGDVNFWGGLASGATTYFSLEEAIDSTAFAGPGGGITTGGGVPEPATWAMMLIGIGAVGGVLRMNRRDLATA